MKNPWILKHLVIWMESHEIPPATRDAFQAAWTRLAATDQLLCPNCFQGGHVEPLLVMNETEGVEPLICPQCRTQYDIPIH